MLTLPTLPCVSKSGRILLANLLHSSSSTFSCTSFPSFFAFQEGICEAQISALGVGQQYPTLFCDSRPIRKCPILQPTLSNLGCNLLNLLDSAISSVSISPIISKGVLNVGTILLRRDCYPGGFPPVSVPFTQASNPPPNSSAHPMDG